jgi:hypothetical protein
LQPKEITLSLPSPLEGEGEGGGEILHKDLTEEIIKVSCKVYNRLGYGFEK